MIRFRKIFTLWLALPLLLLIPVACHLTNQDGEATLGIAGDISWTSHDRLIVLLEDGRGTDTLFDGKLNGMDTLATLPAGGYSGGQAVFIIQGFRNGDLAYEERRSYDGSRQQVVALEVPFDWRQVSASSSLDVWPDQVRLFLGGAGVPLEVLPLSMRDGRALVWKTGNSGVATVSQDGVLSPVGEGATFVQAISGDTLRDASAVRVIRDIPKVDAGAADTTVPAGMAVTFNVTVTQEYGDVAAFAWDLNGDGAMDDSAVGTAGQTRFTAPPRAFTTGEVKVRFRVRDGEGNRGEAGKLVRVSHSAPKIDSLGAKPVMVGIKDTVAFAALAVGRGALLRSFAWDFNGDGTDEIAGSLQGEKAPVAGAYAYPQPDTYLARLRIEDANGVTVTSEVTVTVKLDRPFADAGANRTALAGAEVRLQGTGRDTLGLIVSREWKCGAADFTSAGDSGIHLFTAPSAAATTLCVFRITDDDGLSAEDSLNVVVDEVNAPTLSSFTPSDTTISIRDSVVFAASAAAGTADLLGYSLDIDGDKKAEQQGALSGRSGEIRIGRRFSSEGRFDMTLTVEDKSGKIATRSARVLVLLDTPKAWAGNDTTVVAGTRVNLRGTASDSLGSVAHTEWKIGAGPFVRVSGRDTSFNAPNAPGSPVNLVCVFRVTDDDGQSVEDIVQVTVSPSSAANLASLSVSAGNLNPDFSANTDTYSLGVPNATSTLVVTPIAAQPGASIMVNGNAVGSGQGASVPISLTGVTTITIMVTAQDTVVKKPYTLMVIRAARTNAKLSDLVVSTGTLDPLFTSDTQIYILSVMGNSVRVTPTAADPDATIQVNQVTVATGSPSDVIDVTELPKDITVRVTAPDRTTVISYTLIVTRPATGP